MTLNTILHSVVPLAAKGLLSPLTFREAAMRSSAPTTGEFEAWLFNNILEPFADRGFSAGPIPSYIDITVLNICSLMLNTTALRTEPVRELVVDLQDAWPPDESDRALHIYSSLTNIIPEHLVVPDLRWRLELLLLSIRLLDLNTKSFQPEAVIQELFQLSPIEIEAKQFFDSNRMKRLLLHDQNSLSFKIAETLGHPQEQIPRD